MQRTRLAGWLPVVLLVLAWPSVARAQVTEDPLFPPFLVRLELSASDVQPVNVSAVFGFQHLYVRATLGTGRGSQYVGGLSVGWRFSGMPQLEIDGGVLLVQALTKEARGTGPWSLVDYETDLLSQLRFAANFPVNEHFSAFAGVTANYQVSFGPNVVLPGSYLPPLILLAPPTGGGGHQLWLGGVAGARF